jgi:hypothetical protein
MTAACGSDSAVARFAMALMAGAIHAITTRDHHLALKLRSDTEHASMPGWAAYQTQTPRTLNSTT